MERYSIPKTRDPFINAPFISAGVDPETGLERFWCSSWNDNVGSTGVLIRADGSTRVYRFEKDPDVRWVKCGFYTAHLADNDTLWLIGNTSVIHRLTLSTGELQAYQTGLPVYLLGRGSVYDPVSKKILFSTFIPPCGYTAIFDTERCEMVRVYQGGFDRADGGFAWKDGTFLVNYTSDREKQSTLKCWNPKDDSVETVTVLPLQGWVRNTPKYLGRRYFEGHGWLGEDGTFVQEHLPNVPGICWNDANERFAVGSKPSGRDLKEVFRWEFASGEVVRLGEVCDTPECSVCITEDDGIACFSIYGQFVRFDRNGNRVVDVMCETDSIGLCDCVLRADESTVVGTPFITQRFWTLDTESGNGCDRGRATAGVGEVMRTWYLGGKVYMASYTEGQITEFDPKRGGCFPENPRVVAEPAHSMRPMGAAKSSTTIYSAATHHYGEHGFELTSYNTVTGEAKYHDDPIPNQQIVSLYYNEKHHMLIGASDSRSDCELAPRVDDRAVVALFDPNSLEVLQTFNGPQGSLCMGILGPKDEDCYYVAVVESGWGGPIERVGVFDLRERKLDVSVVDNFPNYDSIKYAGAYDTFVIREGERLYLSRGGFADRSNCIMTVPNLVRYWCSEGEVFAVSPTEIFIQKIS
ncbi:MAG: hypothetical protein IJC88_06050 [Oscillospiraceae bacterium]|nr:hypothetical protein [Oscillospiraceae bacterium]